MQQYHKPALAGNNTGLPFFSGMPLFDWLNAANSNNPKTPFPAGLTAGGRVVFERTRRPVSTCNAIARLANIGQEAFAE